MAFSVLTFSFCIKKFRKKNYFIFMLFYFIYFILFILFYFILFIFYFWFYFILFILKLFYFTLIYFICEIIYYLVYFIFFINFLLMIFLLFYLFLDNCTCYRFLHAAHSRANFLLHLRNRVRTASALLLNILTCLCIHASMKQSFLEKPLSLSELCQFSITNNKNDQKWTPDSAQLPEIYFLCLFN